MSEFQSLKRTRMRVLLILVSSVLLFAPSPARADHSFIIPARDNGCVVDLQVEAEHGAGRARIGYGDITFTNLMTGATYLQRSRYTETATFDPSTKSLHIKVTGNIWISVFPGEPGPSGVVEEPGLELLVSGTLEFTLNRQGAITAFSLTGTYDDLCARLTN